MDGFRGGLIDGNGRRDAARRDGIEALGGASRGMQQVSIISRLH